MCHDPQALIAGVSSAHVRFVIGLSGIVSPTNPISLELIQNTGMAAAQMSRNISDGISLRSQGADVKPLAAGDFCMMPIIFFMTQS